MSDAINQLWYETCGKLHHSVETKYRSHPPYHEEWVQKKISHQDAIGVSIDRNGCAVPICKERWAKDASAPQAMWIIMGALSSIHYVQCSPFFSKCLSRGLKYGLTSNKPTYYLLECGNYKTDLNTINWKHYAINMFNSRCLFTRFTVQ